jgi:hypothetical protein
MSRVLEELATRQHGVLTRRQLLACGVTAAHLRAQLRAGRWQRLSRRVYATSNGELARPSQLWSAVLSAGYGAALSHITAAELVGLVDGVSAVVHVTVPSTRRITPLGGVAVHYSARIEQARHPSRLPPQTRVEETVLDLAQEAASLDDALSWMTRACGRRLTTAHHVREAMSHRQRIRWRRELLAALGDVAAGCQSPLELHYLRDVERAHGLPSATRQAARRRRGGRWYDDVHYAGYRTRVELDGRAAHPVDHRFRDMRRDNSAAVDGDTVLRYGWSDVTERCCEVAGQVAMVLRRHGWRGTPRSCGHGCLILKSSGGHSDPNSSR